ncbi:MAG: hypothetical protein A2283_03050 [Lentisphaerae bacterium RIFOXYA12_FULL_48_11]|nr:MAG: hypothetical protein A2283_03050 [Lentisphaerae bacterium RIFOXYA12_FULL_48_11]
MKETSWVKDILQPSIQKIVSAMGDESLQVLTRKKLPYAGCVTRYEKNNKPSELEMQSYETDILITETFSNLSWCPRVLIETKLETITTHDAISFGQKACTHKNIHPYLRYGVLLGAFEGPVPGHLVVHGGHFDFMMVWQKSSPNTQETEQIINIIRSEIEASRQTEDLIRTRRTKDKKHVYSLQRRLEIKN